MIAPEAVPGSRVTQRFGKAVPAVALLEPAMWATADRAYWTRFTGASFYPHFHPGIDESAPLGAPFKAREAGTVILAGYHNNISGYVVRVEIRPGVSRYGGNHFAQVLVRPGDHVKKGQTLAAVGHSGSATGNSTHTYVEIYEKGIGWVCYNPALFVSGGKLQNDPRIQPITPAPTRLVHLKGPGINVRITPDLDIGVDNLYATSRADGIYAYPSGKRIHTNIFTGFQYRKDILNDDGAWVEVYGFNRVLFIYRSLVTFT